MIRKAKPEDLNGCLLLLKRFSDGILELGAQTFVCQQGENIAGFVICKVLDNRLPFGVTQRIGQIDTIIVDKNLGNYGYIMHLLYDRAEKYFEDVGCQAADAMIVASNDNLCQYALNRGAHRRTPQVIVYRKEL